jgi:hypothetical protein
MSHLKVTLAAQTGDNLAAKSLDDTIDDPEFSGV